MQKKINKYSWIHQLNQAALESKLLSEAKLVEQQMNPFEQSLQRAGADVGMYRKIRDLKIQDFNNDGSANAEDVKQDAEDWHMGGEAPSRMPTFPWAHQEGMPQQQVYPPAKNFGNMSPNEITRAANLERRGDEIIDTLHAEMDADTDRIRKNAPKKYGMGHLQHIANLLANS